MNIVDVMYMTSGSVYTYSLASKLYIPSKSSLEPQFCVKVGKKWRGGEGIHVPASIFHNLRCTCSFLLLAVEQSDRNLSVGP